jgi:hypothetical protein
MIRKRVDASVAVSVKLAVKVRVVAFVSAVV